MWPQSAAQHNLIPARPTTTKRKPLLVNDANTNQLKPNHVDDIGIRSPVQNERGSLLSASDAGTQTHSQVNQSSGYHNVHSGEDKYARSSTHSQSKFVRLNLDWWLMEILSLTLSLAAFTAIVVVLQIFDHHPLPNWPYHITLNTFLALFTAIANAGFMLPVFEGLSQLKWIWFLHGQRPLADFQLYDDACSGGFISRFQLLRTLKGR
jgi:hypothetical protein